MFCSKCGNAFVGDVKFCSKCGAARTEIPTNKSSGMDIIGKIPNIDLNSSAASAANKLKSFNIANKKVAVLIGAIALVFVVSLTVAANHPMLNLQRATGGLESELHQRLETSPLQGLVILSNNFSSGTTDIGFSYSTGDIWGMSVNGDLELMSNTNRREFALHGNITAMGVPADVDVYLNRTRLAVRVPMISSDFFGITFSTFERDIQNMAGRLGLDRRAVDDLISIVEVIETFVNSDAVDVEAVIQPYINFVERTLRNANRNTSRQRIDVNDSQVRANRIHFTFTAEDGVNILRDFYELIAQDENLQALFYLDGMGVRNFDRMLRDIRQEIDFMERNADNSDDAVYVVAYIGARNRLVRLHIETPSWGDRRDVVQINFGQNALDTWSILNFTVGYEDQWVHGIEWRINETNNGYENIVSNVDRHIERGEERSHDIIVSDWNTNNGNFRAVFHDGWSRVDVSGSFDLHDRGRGFRIHFDSFDVGRNETLRLSIGSSRNANINNISFINISDWESHLIQNIQRAIFDLGIGRLF